MFKAESSKGLRDRRGSALPLTLIFMLIMSVGVAAFLKYTSSELNSTASQNDSVRAFYYSEAGIQYGLNELIRGWHRSSFVDPFYFIDHESMTTMPRYAMVKENTPEEGNFDVRIISVETPYNDARDITLKSTGKYHDRTRRTYSAS